jgi:hypothetical protein
MYTQFMMGGISPGRKWWWTILEIEISCSKCEGSACTQSAPSWSAWDSPVKDSETLLEASVTIVMGVVGSYVNPNLLLKMEVFIKIFKKM